jgi:hypothetical protein
MTARNYYGHPSRRPSASADCTSGTPQHPTAPHTGSAMEASALGTRIRRSGRRRHQRAQSILPHSYDLDGNLTLASIPLSGRVRGMPGDFAALPVALPNSYVQAAGATPTPRCGRPPSPRAPKCRINAGMWWRLLMCRLRIRCCTILWTNPSMPCVCAFRSKPAGMRSPVWRMLSSRLPPASSPAWRKIGCIPGAPLPSTR